MVQRVLGLPSALMGIAIGQVFFQAAVKERKKTGQARSVFISTVKKLFIVSLPFFIIVFFVVEDLFAFIFGEDWRIAGIYSKILLPLFFIKLLSSPVSMINTVFEKQIYGLIISIILLTSNIGIIFVSYILGLEIKIMFTILSVILFFEYSIFLLHYYLLSGGDYISRFFSGNKN